jgi:glycosyltransferase involved in cell wall biosynthesis
LVAPSSVATIIPAYNAEAFIASTIESALAQDHPRHEIVVVDDGSTDSTAELAARHRGTTVIRQENCGPASARNRGIAASRSDLIAILDADDLMMPGRVSAQAGYLDANPEKAGVLGRQRITLEPGLEPPSWILEARMSIDYDDAPATGRDMPHLPIYPFTTLMFRRSVFEQVGAFDVSFWRGEDLDWMFRASEQGHVFGTLEQIVIERRVHGSNLTNDSVATRDAAFRALRARIERNRARASARAHH